MKTYLFSAYKLVIYSFLFSSYSFSQTQGEIITKDFFNNKFLELSNEAIPKFRNITVPPITNDNILAEDINTRLELFEFFDVNENVSPYEVISANSINTLFNNVKNKITNYYYESCNDILTKNPSRQNQDGNYQIKINETLYTVYCDMTREEGGWTRLNSAIAGTEIKSFNANQQINGNNVPQGCGGTNANFRVKNIIIPHTLVRFDFTRQATIMQCTRLGTFSNAESLTPVKTGYYSNGNLTQNEMCLWGDNIWAKELGNNTINGLQNNWRIISYAQGNSFSVASSCSSAQDNGSFTSQVFVK